MLTDITRHRIVPVVVCSDAARAHDLGQALVDGGLPVAEVTFRTDAALATLESMAARGDLVVGAGTVIDPAQVDRAADAGATFVVSPGLSVPVVERAQELGLDVLPGTATPGEIMQALALGLTTTKFFPASVYGGHRAIKALAAPFPQLSFVPTGGVGPDNLADYLALPCVPAVGGSWMVPPATVDAGDFEAITRLTRSAVDAACATV